MTGSARPRAVLFDLGGVLVALAGIALFRGWLDNKVSEVEMWNLWLDSPAVQAYERGHMTTAEFGEAAVAEFGLPMTPDVFLGRFGDFVAGLYPGVPDLLGRIRPGVRRACLSNTNALHWDKMRDEMGLGGLLDHHYASHLIGEVKPDAAAYAAAIDGLELAPGDILYLDDVARNVEAGRGAGLRAEQVQGVAALEAVLASYDLLIT